MTISFDRPEFLWLLALLPLLVWIGYRRLRSLSRVQFWLALGVRCVVVLVFILAVAGIQFRIKTDRVAVMYLLDQSESIEKRRRDAMFDFARDNVLMHRRAAREDLAGVILFGMDAEIEVPPFQGNLPIRSSFDRTRVRGDATNLEQALRLAQSSMPTDTRRRIVLITDGNETRGQASRVAAQLKASGIGVDIVAVPTQSGNDVLVEKIDMPSAIRLGQPIETRILMTNFSSPESDRPVRGRLNITRSSGREEELLLDEPIELTPGKNLFPLRHTIDRAASYTYSAKFIPDSPADDIRAQNNSAMTFVNVRGKSRVLLISSPDETTAWDDFANKLREQEIEVVIQPSDTTFGSLAELQAYDVVVLANVARVSGDSADALRQFTDEQVSILVRNTRQLGAGLLMIGGPDSLGAGGWTGTELEKAMPVDFEIKNSKVAAVGALSLVIDSSGSMDGEKMVLCKSAAQAAVRMLGPTDYVGIHSFDSETREVIPMQPVAGRTHMMPMIARIRAGGGTDMFPAMKQGFISLVRTDAAVKHMIVLTDGRTAANDFNSLAQQMKDAGITVTSVAIGHDADVDLMRQISSIGGGKLYHVLSPRAIPQIVMRESRRVSRPLIFESSEGVQPMRDFPHPLLAGMGEPPPIYGYVMTSPKDSSLVQTLITAPGPQESAMPILSLWQYGLGRSAVLTTDVGKRWAANWNAWPEQTKLYTQLIRWLMRPSGDTGQYTIDTIARDGEVQVVVNALSKDNEYLNFLEMQASVLDPDLTPLPMTMRQTSPGRYVGVFSPERSGSFFVQVQPDPTSAPLSTAVTVPMTREYRVREMNHALLQQLASDGTADGEPGELTLLSSDKEESETMIDPFRDGLSAIRSIEDVWPMMVLLGCCIFVGDVLVRRVRLTRILPQRSEPKREPASRTLSPTKDTDQSMHEESVEEFSSVTCYTERLLQAKKRASR